MAKPRVFLSSTFYDLRQVRSDIERFIREMGYETILAERGNIPYGNHETPEAYCYKEIELCDILVAIVGGTFGSPSQQHPYSISQAELKTALEHGKQVYIFVERGVQSELQTYLVNKGRSDLAYHFVDDTRVYEFLDEIRALPRNNPTFPFETSQEIVSILREQWAGQFQRFLQDQSRVQEIRVLEGLQGTAKTLNELVTYVIEESKDKDQAVQDILRTNHPALQRIRELFTVTYPVYFSSRTELSAWLVAARKFDPVPPEDWDDPEFEEWMRRSGPPNKQKLTLLKVYKEMFEDSGQLRPITRIDWDEWYITLETRDVASAPLSSVGPAQDFDPFADE